MPGLVAHRRSAGRRGRPAHRRSEPAARHSPQPGRQFLPSKGRRRGRTQLRRADSVVRHGRGETPGYPVGALQARRQAMRVALLFDGASAMDVSPDLLIIETVEAIETALVNEGNSVVRVPVMTDGKWI